MAALPVAISPIFFSCRQQFCSGSLMDSTVNASSHDGARISRIDDGIYLHFRYIVAYDF